MNPQELKAGDIIKFAGPWYAKVSEKIRSDVVFVETVWVGSYGHHAFGIDHPIWQSAEVVEGSGLESV